MSRQRSTSMRQDLHDESKSLACGELHAEASPWTPRIDVSCIADQSTLTCSVAQRPLAASASPLFAYRDVCWKHASAESSKRVRTRPRVSCRYFRLAKRSTAGSPATVDLFSVTKCVHRAVVRPKGQIRKLHRGSTKARGIGNVSSPKPFAGSSARRSENGEPNAPLIKKMNHTASVGGVRGGTTEIVSASPERLGGSVRRPTAAKSVLATVEKDALSLFIGFRSTLTNNLVHRILATLEILTQLLLDGIARVRRQHWVCQHTG